MCLTTWTLNPSLSATKEDYDVLLRVWGDIETEMETAIAKSEISLLHRGFYADGTGGCSVGEVSDAGVIRFHQWASLMNRWMTFKLTPLVSKDDVMQSIGVTYSRLYA